MRDEKSTTLTDHLTKYRMLKPSLSLKDVSDLKVTEATQILCSVLCCYEAVDRIEELPEGWRLIAASCIYLLVQESETNTTAPSCEGTSPMPYPLQ